MAKPTPEHKAGQDVPKASPATPQPAPDPVRGASAGQPSAPRRPRLRLPFDNRGEDIGSWSYDHRIGLCVTLIAYLVLMIVFVSSKIVVGQKEKTQTMYIDLQQLADLEKERDRLLEETRRKQQQDPIDWSSIRNRSSNENALNEQLEDDRGTNAAAINEAAEEAQERMRQNREAYERGLAEEQRIRSSASAGKSGGEHKDSKAKGRVTVSFSFTDPTRTSRYIHIPAYLCEGGGEVVVEATINCSGKVISAKVLEGGDQCMREAALNAARRSKFNIDNNAPSRQSGTISYIFIPQ